MTILRELRSRGKTVVCVHHDLQTVPEYFDHVALINMRIVAQGPVDRVCAADGSHTGRILREFLATRAV